MRKVLGLLFLLPSVVTAQLNGSAILSGRVIGEQHEGLPSVSISLKGATGGTTTDSAGRFALVCS